MPLRHAKKTASLLGNALLIVLGVLSAGMGLRGFLLYSNFIDGGVTGICMLVAKVSKSHLSVWLPIVNFPFIVLGYRQLGRAFALKSLAAISGLSLAVAFIPYPIVTNDRVLTAVFGGFFLGAGIGLAVRGGAVLDGTEIAALIISKRTHLLRLGDVILGFNVVLFLAAMKALGVEAALYSILTYLAAAKTLDYVLYGVEQYTAITIVSNKSPEIRDAITHQLGRGVTVYRGFGGMSKKEEEILYCVVTKLEIGQVKAIVASHDAAAFVTYDPLAGVQGGVVTKPAFQEE